MPVTISFEPTRLGIDAGEEACLGLVDGHIVTVLVRLAESSDVSEDAPWYLEAGFGPCDGQGVIFADLAAAEAWIKGQFGQQVDGRPVPAASAGALAGAPILTILDGRLP